MRRASGIGTVLIVLTIAGYPLISVFPVLLNESSRVFTLPYRGFVLAISLWILFARKRPPANRAQSMFIALFLGLWYFMLLRLGWHALHPTIIAGSTVEDYALLSIGGCVIPSLAIVLKLRSDEVNAARVILRYLLPIVCLLVLYCAFVVAPQDAAYRRLATSTLNPLSIGHLGLTTLVLAIWTPGSSDFGFREGLMKGIAIAIGLTLIALSASKGPVLALLAIAAVSVISKRGLASRLKVGFRVAVLVVISSAALIVVEQETHFSPIGRIMDMARPEQAMEQEARGGLMGEALQQFLQNPILGSGIVEQKSSMYPHNIFVEALMTTGILGGLLMLWIVGLCTVTMWRLVQKGDHTVWVGYLFVQRLVSSTLSGSIYTTDELWTSLSLVMASDSTSKMSASAATVSSTPGQEDTPSNYGTKE